MKLLEQLRRHAAERPRDIALDSAAARISFADLATAVDAFARQLQARGHRTIALDACNGAAWLVADLAALQAGVCMVPVPPFFSTAQVRHLLDLAGIDALLTDDLSALQRRAGDLRRGDRHATGVAGAHLHWLHRHVEGPDNAANLPADIAKVTFTSGTTGNPKGAMLTARQLDDVVESLAGAVELRRGDRHLMLMPLAVLLENVAGAYLPLWRGASAVARPLDTIGMRGSSDLAPANLVAALRETAATTVVCTPQVLQGLVEHLEANPCKDLGLRFVAVGGAPTPRRLLDRAAAVDLPVYEGYGLSECASVVCLNTPRHQRTGSVGKPLPHASVAIDGEGQVLVRNAGFRGYLGEPRNPSEDWATGDIGEFDSDGFLYLTGRHRNVFITAYGRNVSPDWVESEMRLDPAIAQIAVFGEARPFNVAVVVPDQECGAEQLAAAIARCNSQLPDYARVARWIPAQESFRVDNGLLTGTGRVRRDAVWVRYAAALQTIYREEMTA